MIEDRATDHLTPIEPAESVLEICEKLGRLNLSRTTRLELRAFRETRTPHDGRRLINSYAGSRGKTKRSCDVGMQ